MRLQTRVRAGDLVRAHVRPPLCSLTIRWVTQRPREPVAARALRPIGNTTRTHSRSSRTSGASIRSCSDSPGDHTGAGRGSRGFVPTARRERPSSSSARDAVRPSPSYRLASSDAPGFQLERRSRRRRSALPATPRGRSGHLTPRAGNIRSRRSPRVTVPPTQPQSPCIDQPVSFGSHSAPRSPPSGAVAVPSPASWTTGRQGYRPTKSEKARQMASSPVSPVRMRTALSMELTKILPSPIRPVLALFSMASSTC